MRLELERDGAHLFRQALCPNDLQQLERILPTATGAGQRIYDNSELAGWLTDGPVGAIARDVLGAGAHPVRAILFDKTIEANWTLGWHQDRTIAVRERIDAAGLEHWTRKAGAIHVEPPFEFIERMLTFRLHLDPVPSGNAPLLIAPGSHRFGRISEDRIESVVDQCGSVACLADAGDAWVYRSPILHASKRVTNGARRRVLQIEFSADSLPGGLDWLGVG